MVALFRNSEVEGSCLTERTNFRTDTRSVSQSVAIARSWQAAALAREQMEIEKLQDRHTEKSKRARILVCAQSNAAVDELVLRLCKDGLYDINGGYYKPYLVRVGNAKTLHPNSLPFFIDTLVANRLEADKHDPSKGAVENTKTAIQLLRGKLDKIVDSIQVLEAQISRSHNSIGIKGKQNTASDSVNYGVYSPEGAEQASHLEVKRNTAAADGEEVLKVKINMLYKQRRQICGELAVMQAEEKRSFEEDRSKRQQLKREIIRQAEVVVATLNGCGGDVYSACMENLNNLKKQGKILDGGLFDAVVIDEAAQALEPATLIPLQLLKHSRAKCIMVGDPKQLPATVLSQLASRFSYECSMFERLQRGGHPVTMLSTQYRMHPEIRHFPSAHFYENQLQDGEGITKGRIALFHSSKYFGPYVVFDVVEGFEKVKHRSTSQSLCNEAEAEVALEIFKRLKTRYPDEVHPGRIGVITPYQQQLSLLRERFTRLLGQRYAKVVEFNTVDGFQGREVDILIFSTVRAAKNSHRSSGVGFVADVRRMNVALTRAKFALWVVCHGATLQTSPPWAALLKNARERGVLHTVRSPYKAFFDLDEMCKNNDRESSYHLSGQAISELEDFPEKRLLQGNSCKQKTADKKCETSVLSGDEHDRTTCVIPVRRHDGRGQSRDTNLQKAPPMGSGGRENESSSNNALGRTKSFAEARNFERASSGHYHDKHQVENHDKHQLESTKDKTELEGSNHACSENRDDCVGNDPKMKQGGRFATGSSKMYSTSRQFEALKTPEKNSSIAIGRSRLGFDDKESGYAVKTNMMLKKSKLEGEKQREGETRRLASQKPSNVMSNDIVNKSYRHAQVKTDSDDKRCLPSKQKTDLKLAGPAHDIKTSHSDRGENNVHPSTFHGSGNVEKQGRILRPKRQREDAKAGVNYELEQVRMQEFTLQPSSSTVSSTDSASRLKKVLKATLAHDHALIPNETLHKEWERFEKILAEMKALYPLHCKTNKSCE